MAASRTPRGAYTGSLCRSCRTPKPSRLYLCAGCWFQIPAASRRALSGRGDRGGAITRIRQLHDHIDAGQPLGDLEITAMSTAYEVPALTRDEVATTRDRDPRPNGCPDCPTSGPVGHWPMSACRSCFRRDEQGTERLFRVHCTCDLCF
ncbi:hypothetical protein HUT18_11860 [Streptomyces sp. NA04227]|uniref:hypothetical protein n=1 Tax=Streptomyces sp. NA04227 TaxID=2742136 RepID=UPI001590FE1B|nr:hypothetical protein [Streptomyces sp. NA04227]QKW06993.1 hypothetical protein HUT18_11860 [Streptomyces sp. NA04227]